MKVGDFVVVIGTTSLPSSFLGRYGKIVEDYGHKVAIQFNQRINGIGSLNYTAFREDLRKEG